MNIEEFEKWLVNDLYQCESCGFLSTLASAFVRFKGIRVCECCKKDYENGDPNAKEWIDGRVKTNA